MLVLNFLRPKNTSKYSYAMVLSSISPPIIWDSYNLWYFAPCLVDNMYIWMFSRGNCFPTREVRDCIGKHWKYTESENILIRGFRGRVDCAIPWQWWSQRRKVMNSDEEWERGWKLWLFIETFVPREKIMNFVHREKADAEQLSGSRRVSDTFLRLTWWSWSCWWSLSWWWSWWFMKNTCFLRAFDESRMYAFQKSGPPTLLWVGEPD